MHAMRRTQATVHPLPGWCPVWLALGSALALLGTASAQADSDDGVFVVGRAAEVASGQRVEAAIVVGGDLTVRGHVDGVAVAVGGDVRVAEGGRVDGGATAVGGVLTVAPTAVVSGPRVHVEGGDFGQVVGQLAEQGPAHGAPPTWLGSVFRLFQVLSVFALGVLLLWLAPRSVERVRDTMRFRPAQATLAGLLLMLSFVPLCLLLAVSLIGIPLIPLAVLALVGLFVMGLSAVALGVGERVPVSAGRLGAFALGSLALLVVAVLPVLGGLALFLGSFYGAGAVILSRFGTQDPPARTAADPLADELGETAPEG